MRLKRITIGITTAFVLAACGQGQSEPSLGSTHLPELVSDDSLPAGEAYLFEVGTHCGVGYLGLPINDRFWISDEAAGMSDWIPTEWADTLDPGEELITLEVELSTDEAVLTATAAGRPVAYRPVTSNDPVFECA